jgi:hypothetical protein
VSAPLHTVRVEARVRYGRDLQAVSDRLADLGLEMKGAALGRTRGGRVMATVDLIDNTREEAQAKQADLAQAIRLSPWFIDRLDTFQVVTSQDDRRVIGYAMGDFRGWLREDAMAEAREAMEEARS